MIEFVVEVTQTRIIVSEWKVMDSVYIEHRFSGNVNDFKLFIYVINDIQSIW